jgi:hypothetical protein
MVYVLDILLVGLSAALGIIGYMLFRSMRGKAGRYRTNTLHPFWRRRRFVLLSPSVISALLLLIAIALTRWWPEVRNFHGFVPQSTGSCDIKGNIAASGERIYHLPSNRYYDETTIDDSRGERWFCSESEAIAAGWRPAKV